MKDTLQGCVDIALQNCLDQRGFTDSQHLLGDCYNNTKELAKILRERDIDYTIYRGALENDFREDEHPDTFEEAQEIGRVHYWVESHGFVCELSSEDRANYGEPLVAEERPPNYLVFPDSEVPRL